VTDLTRAIELDPKYAWALAQRGEAYGQMGRYDEAVTDLTRAIELDPKPAWALAVRGEAYRQMGRYDEAMTDLTRAIELDPKSAWTLASLGATYYLINRYDDALADLTRAIELDPKSSQALAIRGETYRLMEQYEAAVADLTRSLELDPNDWIYYERGLTYLAMQKPAQAQPDFAEAIRRSTQTYQENPQNNRNTFNLALYHLMIGKLEDADRLYQEAFPGADVGLIREVIDDLTNFLRLFPEHPQAQAFRARLQQRLEEMESPCGRAARQELRFSPPG